MFRIFCLLLALGHSQSTILAQDKGNVFRVGDWTCERDITFAVASPKDSELVVFVFGDSNKLHFTRSTDSGQSWSEPVYFADGTAQNIAVDTNNDIHVVYVNNGDKSRVFYRRISGNKIGDAQDLTTAVAIEETRCWAPQIAVDGNDNVHILYWSAGSKEDKAAKWRTVYCYKPADERRFLAPELWRDKAGTGHSKYGAIAVDHAGDVHLFYTSASAKPRSRWLSHGFERRVRHKDGRWGEHSRWESSLLADWSMSALVDTDGVVHVATQKQFEGQWKMAYMVNKENRSSLDVAYVFGVEPTETYTDLATDRDGNILLATGHRDGPRKSNRRSPANVASLYRFDKSTNEWSKRELLSSVGTLNFGARQSGNPQFCEIDGTLQLYYATSLAEDAWKHVRKFVAKQ